MDNKFLSLRNALLPLYEPREARALALMVLEDAFGIAPVDVYADKVRNFSEEETDRLQNIAQRLSEGEPVQYVLGFARFDGRAFRVGPATLIPRPETEELVAWVAADHLDAPPRRLLDAGTGSGCIAVSLALRLPQMRVEAWDISPEALALAADNARRLGATVAFAQCDLLAPPPAGPYDVIVSNPPYVCEAERAGMQPHVLRYEPATALFVPDADPLRFYRALAELGHSTLAPGGSLYMEINEALAAETERLFLTSGYARAELRHDAFGKPRMLKVW